MKGNCKLIYIPILTSICTGHQSCLKLDLSVILLIFCKHHRHLLQEYMLLNGNTYEH